MRIFLFFVFIIPTTCYGFWGDSCSFEGNVKNQKIVLYFLGPDEGGYGLKGSQTYGYCTPGKLNDYVQNTSLSCAAKKGGKQVVYYETNTIQYPKTAKESMSASTYVCKSGCEGNIVQTFIRMCDPD